MRLSRPCWRAVLAGLALSLACGAGTAHAERFTVCTLGFNTPDELAVFRARLPVEDFDVVDLSPHLLAPAGALSAAGEASSPTATNGAPWLLDSCRDDLRCDVVVYSAEFGGRFFGKFGYSLGLQDMEEASCRPECAGLFTTPQEVFLIACNTLATKDQDSRTPREYLQVLLDHGFDRSAAERVVELRYGPLGPSFGESLRRSFATVPRIYGFSSVAPRSAYTTPRLERYFASVKDYAAFLRRNWNQTTPNTALLSAFAGTGLRQTRGATPTEPAGQARERICALFDEERPLVERLRIAGGLMHEQNFLAFVPTIEAFLNRHPADEYQGEARAAFDDMRDQEAAREQVLRLVHDLSVSALKLELAHFARHMEWLSEAEMRTIAIDGARQLMAQELTSEAADITCEITKHVPLSATFKSDDLPDKLFTDSVGVQMIDCIHPDDPRVVPRLVDAMSSPDVFVRLWAVYALSRRRPLDDATLRRLADHLHDDAPGVRERVEWIFRASSPASPSVRQAVARQDPVLARALAPDEPPPRRSWLW